MMFVMFATVFVGNIIIPERYEKIDKWLWICISVIILGPVALFGTLYCDDSVVVGLLVGLCSPFIRYVICLTKKYI